MNPKLRKALFFVLLMTLLAGLVYAALELAGQSNKAAADAGTSAADMEMASLDTIKKPANAPSNINWSQESSLRKAINKADAEYRTQLDRAKSDINGTGMVSESTRTAGMNAAGKFKAASDEYAKFWDRNNGRTRANLAREAGASRIKSAEMAFSNVNSGTIDAYSSQQDSLRTAQKAYLADAKTDLSPADREALKSGLAPRVERLASDVMGLVTQVTSLLSQVQSQVGSVMTPSGAAGCAGKVISGQSNPANEVSALISPLTSLLSLLKTMGSNVQGLASDLLSL